MSLMKSKKGFHICEKEFNTDEFNTEENDKNEFNTDEYDENSFNTDENDKNDFNTNENDENNEVNDHCHYTGNLRGAADNICNLRYKAPKEILVFHNGSTYDYHLIINQLAKEFKGQLKCLGENCINFSLPIKKLIIKQLRTD